MLYGSVEVHDGEVHRLSELVDVDVLDDVLFLGVGHAEGVPGSGEAEITQGRVAPEVERIGDRDERKGAAARGEPELGIADGADGHAGVGIAGEAVQHLHADLGQRELERIDVIKMRQRDEVGTEGVVPGHAGLYAIYDEGRGEQASDPSQES